MERGSAIVVVDITIAWTLCIARHGDLAEQKCSVIGFMELWCGAITNARSFSDTGPPSQDPEIANIPVPRCAPPPLKVGPEYQYTPY